MLFSVRVLVKEVWDTLVLFVLLVDSIFTKMAAIVVYDLLWHHSTSTNNGSAAILSLGSCVISLQSSLESHVTDAQTIHCVQLNRLRWELLLCNTLSQKKKKKKLLQ